MVESHPDLCIDIYIYILYTYIYIYKITTCTNMEPVDRNPKKKKKKTSSLDLTPHFCTVAVSRPESTAATIEKSHSGCFPTSATPGEAPISEGQHKRRWLRFGAK